MSNNPLLLTADELVDVLKKKWLTANNQLYLKSIEIHSDAVPLRGIKQGKLEFSFPLTVISGSNGAGKTTFLQLATCAFHSPQKPISLPKGYYKYFRFQDFFKHNEKDCHKEGIEFSFSYNTIATSLNIKKGKERWMRYISNKGGSKRPIKHTEFIGISRILPAFEKKRYDSRFSGKDSNKTACSKEVNKYIKEILNKSCDFGLFESGDFRLNDFGTYTSFNAGAGEECIASILYILLSCPRNSFIAIEEIEIGIHSACLKPLIRVILEIINKKNLQVLITSHSPFFLRNCPKESLIWVKREDNICNFISGPNVEMIINNVGDIVKKQVFIFCEDEVATIFLREIIKKKEILDLVKIIIEGGNSNLPEKAQKTLTKFDIDLKKSLILFDGDCRKNDEIETRSIENAQFFGFKCVFLPGIEEPEVYIRTKLNENPEILKKLFSLNDPKNLLMALNNLKDKKIHDIFKEISKTCGNGEDEDGISKTRETLIRFVCQEYFSEFQEVKDKIDSLLH